MRKPLCIATIVVALAGGPAFGAEFQPLGTLGIGGAGVARTFDAFAPYWNPAGLAFNTTTFSSRLNGGVGIKVNSTMAENVDRIGKLDIDELRDLNITNQADTANNLRLTGKAAEFVGVLNDLNKNDGVLTVNGSAVLGFQYRHFAMGGFSTLELASFSDADADRVAFGGVTDVNGLATAIGAAAAQPGTFFTPAQRAAIAAAYGGNTGIANAYDAHFSANPPVTGQSNDQLKDALVRMGGALTGNRGSLENNDSTLEYRGLALVEFPFSYGHPLSLGSFGTLGVGGSVKVMWGRAFIGESKIVQVKDSGDIVKNITDHSRDSTTVGIDLGALWRYGSWLNVGIVAKNLNSPEFATPEVTVRSGTARGPIKVKPMVRTGVAVEPFSWLTFAADLDLTENDTILLDRKNRTLGGGLELHPFTWLKLRGGAYKNLAEGEIGFVPTAGLTFGSKWVNFDLDGAMALESGKFKDQSYPREARVQFNFNVLF